MVQGTRADVAIMCNSPGTINVRSSKSVGLQPDTGNGFDQEHFFQLVVGPAGSGAAVAMPTSQALLPAYLDDLRAASDVSVGGETGVSTINFDWDPDASALAINQKAFSGFSSGVYVEEYCLDKVYETTLGTFGYPSNPSGPGISTGGAHPYHQHINHFQVTDGGDPSGHVLRDGEWRDTVPAWQTVMRFKPTAYTGLAVVHCHFLQHEDVGMMGLVNLKECPVVAPPTRYTLLLNINSFEVGSQSLFLKQGAIAVSGPGMSLETCFSVNPGSVRSGIISRQWTSEVAAGATFSFRINAGSSCSDDDLEVHCTADVLSGSEWVYNQGSCAAKRKILFWTQSIKLTYQWKWAAI